MADDQGWGDTGYNEHPFVKTPNLDEMSRQGLRFDRFYAAAPVCSPTRGSVLTGRNPNRIKILDHGHYMRPQEETLAEALKRGGYVTGHFGKWHIGSVQKESPVCPGNSGFDEWISAPNYFDIDPYLSDKGIARQYKGESSALVVDWTLNFIKKHADGDKPMFAVVWFAAPHSPHKSLLPEKNMYKGKKGRGYFQEITALDRAFGRLRAGLRKHGIRDNTLLWYCSDNGGLMKESSGGRNKKGSIYEGGLRVPAIIEWPAKIKPAVSALPSFTSDMLPTLLEVAGVKRENAYPLDGVSLLPVMYGRAQKRTKGMGFWRQDVMGQSTFSDKIVKEMMKAQAAGRSPAIPERLKKDIEEFPQHSLSKLPGHAAWLQWPWKLHKIQRKGVEVFELYNLEEDSMEAKDLSASQPERLSKMKAMILQWQQSVVNSLNGKDYK